MNINEFYEKYHKISSYEELKNLFAETFKENKTNFNEMKIINVYEFIGVFATLVSQMELKIFNFFIKDKNIIRKVTDEKSALNVRPIWLGRFIEPWLEYSNSVIVNKEKGFDVRLFAKILNIKNEKIVVKRLKQGYWNYYITNIIDFYGDNLEWFNKIRKYRHEIIHQVDTYKYPFDGVTNNIFKELKTIMDIDKLLRISWEIKNNDFLEESMSKHSNYYISNFLFKNASTIGFISLYNKHEKDNKLYISNLVNHDTSITLSNQWRFRNIDGFTKQYRIKEFLNKESEWHNSIYSRIFNLNINTLKKIGFTIIEE